MSFTQPHRRLRRAGLAAAAVTSVLGGLLAVGLAGPASAATTDLTGVVLNEIESSGDTTDWIELYNTNAFEVDLSGGILSDDDDDHAFPLTGTIEPGGYAVFDVSEGPDGFGLGAPDEARLFQGIDADTGTLKDSFSWTGHATTTYGRNPDGTGSWQVTSEPTKGTANEFPPTTGGGIDGVVLNEVESSGDDTNGDWIELYNTNAGPVNIGGAILSDDDNGHVFTIPANTMIDGHGYAAFTVDASFGLGAPDSARLFAPGDTSLSTPIDSFSWTSHAAVTYGRNWADDADLDGLGDWESTSVSSFGAENVFSGPSAPDLTGVVINEVESSGDDTDGDWIELYNNTGDDVDLSGAILSDNDDAHFIRIPADTTLGAGDYAAFRTDDPDVANNFGLGDADSARLFPADTINLGAVDPVDHFEWTDHAPRTYGRNWTDDVDLDGLGDWEETSAGTFGAENEFGGTITPDVSDVVINEIESSAPSNGADWIELYNTSDTDLDLGGAILSDSQDDHFYTIPANTTITAGGFYTVDIDQVTGGFGLGSADAVRLFRAGTSTTGGAIDADAIPLDHEEWTDHAPVTLGRTDAGLGAWANTTAATKGAANQF